MHAAGGNLTRWAHEQLFAGEHPILAAVVFCVGAAVLIAALVYGVIAYTKHNPPSGTAPQPGGGQRPTSPNAHHHLPPDSLADPPQRPDNQHN